MKTMMALGLVVLLSSSCVVCRCAEKPKCTDGKIPLPPQDDSSVIQTSQPRGTK